MDKDEFPHCVVYGLVVYRFNNPQRNRCLTYWPKGMDTYNLDIIAAGKEEGRRIVDAITSQLSDLAKKLPAN